MKYDIERLKIVIPMILLVASVILSGCIDNDQKIPINKVRDNETLIINYLSKVPILAKEDVPDFELMDRYYFAAADNITVSVRTEGSHRTTIINDSDKVQNGYRIYGGSELYNSSKNIDLNKNLSLDQNLSKNLTERYILLQYKTFDTKQDLNYVLNMSVSTYAKAGYRSKVLNDTNIAYKGRIFILESTNEVGVSRTIILFGNDTVLGKIAVQDSKDRSLNESLKILDIVSDRLNINTKEVKIVKSGVIKAFNDTIANNTGATIN